MKFKNYYYLDKTIEPFSYVDLGDGTKISGSSSGVSINKDLFLSHICNQVLHLLIKVTLE